MSDIDTFDPANSVHDPLTVAKYGVDAIVRARDNQTNALRMHIADVRDYFAPLMPGQVCAIIAQTSNYKSGFMHSWEDAAARQLMDQGRDNECIVHVSVEECVEEQAFLSFARETGEDIGRMARGEVQDWNRLLDAARIVGKIPIYRIGDSIARADDMPNLYLSNIIRAIKALPVVVGRAIKIAALFFDYLQAFPFDPEIRMASHAEQRRLQVRNDIYRIRQAAAYFECPCIVGVQAKQKLDGAPGPNLLIPGNYDGEESSSIAQRVDRIITLWMPKTTHPVGTHLSHKNIEFQVDENLLWLRIGKQRGGLPAGRAWKCRIDFKHNKIAPEAREDEGGF